jgi:hypothetical protein
VTIRQLWQYADRGRLVAAGRVRDDARDARRRRRMNIHGKNNWKVGTIGEHIDEFELLLPSGEIVRCARDERPELFHAAIGGFGMLGCFTSITLRMKRVHSASSRSIRCRCAASTRCSTSVEARMDRADYLVGWMDTFARAGELGRGLIHHANYLHEGEDRAAAQTLRVANQELPPTLVGVVPKSIMWALMRPFTNDPGVRLVNFAKYRMSLLEGQRRYRQSHAGFAFLLDYVPDWKKAYGPGGLIQYQSFLPRTPPAPCTAKSSNDRTTRA